MAPEDPLCYVPPPLPPAVLVAEETAQHSLPDSRITRGTHAHHGSLGHSRFLLMTSSVAHAATLEIPTPILRLGDGSFRLEVRRAT